MNMQQQFGSTSSTSLHDQHDENDDPLIDIDTLEIYICQELRLLKKLCHFSKKRGILFSYYRSVDLSVKSGKLLLNKPSLFLGLQCLQRFGINCRHFSDLRHFLFFVFVLFKMHLDYNYDLTFLSYMKVILTCSTLTSFIL